MEISEDASSNKSTILFREKEMTFLTRFLKKKLCFQYRPLFIYGQTSTGKTLVLKTLLQDLEVPNLWINCHEHYTTQLIFSKVLRSFSISEENNKKINNMADFISFFADTFKNATETTYLIFDCAQNLRKECSSLIPVITKLQKFTKVNVCPIFISEASWDEFIILTSVKPVSLHFPNYSKSEMSEILCLQCPTGFTQNFYNGYINVIMRTFFTVTRNLSELQHMAEVNFEKYCEPLKENPDEELSAMRLWKNIEPTLKEAMSCVYLREISGSKWRTYCQSEDKNKKMPLNSINSNSITQELPCYSKFLLLAAYIASYNQPKTDFKHFVKNQGKQAKKRITKRVDKNRHLLGPKPFTLDRLLSIFFALVGEKKVPSALIFSQISSLIHMRLMSRVSVDEQLDCPKYKCLAGLDLVCKIAADIEYDVKSYLDDFL